MKNKFKHKIYKIYKMRYLMKKDKDKNQMK